MTEQKQCVVLFSGGMDSTACILWALAQGFDIKLLTIAYGQRHSAEIAAANRIRELLGFTQHCVFELGSLGLLAPSALTDSSQTPAVDGGLGGLPNTFVPGRNLIFLSLATAYAISRGIKDIVVGVCQTDYSGYPDCRAAFVNAMEDAAQQAVDDYELEIHAPLMHLSKADTIRMFKAHPLGWEALGQTVTCYRGERPGCYLCPACLLRARGFQDAGLHDPAILKSTKRG